MTFPLTLSLHSPPLIHYSPTHTPLPPTPPTLLLSSPLPITSFGGLYPCPIHRHTHLRPLRWWCCGVCPRTPHFIKCTCSGRRWGWGWRGGLGCSCGAVCETCFAGSPICSISYLAHTLTRHTLTSYILQHNILSHNTLFLSCKVLCLFSNTSSPPSSSPPPLPTLSHPPLTPPPPPSSLPLPPPSSLPFLRRSRVTRRSKLDKG